QTSLASVLPVDFEWSDLGAWDAVHRTGAGSLGPHILEDADNCLIRSPDDVLVAAVGVSNIGVIVERDAVLVTDLSRAQDVKKLVERLKTMSPRHLDFTSRAEEKLEDAGIRYAAWMRQLALPTWRTLGLSEDGAFEEALTLDGRQLAKPRRARVQARQIQVYAQAGRHGWNGPWRSAVAAGLAWLDTHYIKDDGLMRTKLKASGEPLDETAALYDQAFFLLALATAARQDNASDYTEKAQSVRNRLISVAGEGQGFIEAGPHPYQANAHMHLLEAALAWEPVDPDPAWCLLSDRIANLARDVFIDEPTGFLREFFSPDWTPAAGRDGRLVEPGHQFEWSWLLTRYGLSRSNAWALQAGRDLFNRGLRGVEPIRGVAMDSMDVDGRILSRRARLWPQTEWLKASLLLAQTEQEAERRDFYLDQASRALRGLWLYLTPTGLWRDTYLENGDFIDEPAPASSLYHLMGAYTQLNETLSALKPELAPSLKLS
ncbi:hypothetical protein LTR94_025294, partial [Friedmanniomyces endolithicus]